jgi:L-iditol 2-dehydrogenase
MRIAYRTANAVELRNEPLRPLRAGEIRVKVLACGICGTDLHAPTGTDGKAKVMTGHEVAGEILELGNGVTWLQVGQRIVLDSATPCGRCDACHDTRQELCSDIQSFFNIGSFGFADEMIAPAVSAIPCADLSPDIASLQEPLGVAIDLVRLAELRTSSNVLILGQGPIGLIATALARRAGVRRLFATDLTSRPRRLELARQFGADETFDPTQTAIGKFNYGCAIDRILVTAPPKTLPESFEVAAKGAIISYIGIAWGAGAMVSFDADAFHFKKLQLRASFASPALYGPESLRCLREGIVDGAALVSHRFPLARMQEALDVARTDPNAVKVVINP